MLIVGLNAGPLPSKRSSRASSLTRLEPVLIARQNYQLKVSLNDPKSKLNGLNLMCEEEEESGGGGAHYELGYTLRRIYNVSKFSAPNIAFLAF